MAEGNTITDTITDETIDFDQTYSDIVSKSTEVSYSIMADEHTSIYITEKEANVGDIGVIIRGEANSNMLTFTINRYYDNVDLSNKTIAIVYKQLNVLNSVNSVDINEEESDINVDATGIDYGVNITTSDTTMTFAWVLSPTATQYAGELSVSVQFIGKDENENTYVLKTKPFSLTVHDTLTIVDTSTIVKGDVLTKIFEYVDTAREYKDTTESLAEQVATDYTSINNSVTAAATSATAAAESASAAAESQDNAQVSATAASESATAAAESATAAAESATAAAESQNYAADSEGNSQQYALLSQSYANGSSGVRTNEEIDNAKYYYEKSKENSDNTDTNVATITTLANQVSSDAVSAEQSATVAAGNEENSMTYATQAKTYANTALEYKTDAGKYMEQAKEIATSLSGVLKPMGTITFSELPSVSDATAGDMYNISDEFTTTSAFKEGEGITIPLGSNVYLTTDGYWDVLAGTPVTGIKGDAETSYRNGNVNITASDIGLGTADGVSELFDILTVDTSGIGDTCQFPVRNTSGTWERHPISFIWAYIKSKISSVLGLTSSSYGGNAATATKATNDSDGNTINSTYLKKSGGTLTGALNYANRTWNLLGDDCYFGDYDIAGGFCIKGNNSDTPNTYYYKTDGTLYASGIHSANIGSQSVNYATSAGTASKLAGYSPLRGSCGTDSWETIPIIGTDGVMEVGKYLDFHESDNNTSDYDYRIYSASGTMYFTGNISAGAITSSGAITANGTITAPTFTGALTIYCFSITVTIAANSRSKCSTSISTSTTSIIGLDILTSIPDGTYLPYVIPDYSQTNAWRIHASGIWTASSNTVSGFLSNPTGTKASNANLAIFLIPVNNIGETSITHVVSEYTVT